MQAPSNRHPDAEAVRRVIVCALILFARRGRAIRQQRERLSFLDIRDAVDFSSIADDEAPQV